jgi:hypothetical protein
MGTERKLALAAAGYVSNGEPCLRTPNSLLLQPVILDDVQPSSCGSSGDSALPSSIAHSSS